MISCKPPQANPDLVGHLPAEDILRQAAKRQRLHHAWLLTGDEGVGKATLAYRFGRAVLAKFPNSGLQVPPSHPIFAQIAAGAHPDLVAIGGGRNEKRRERAAIVIDDARQVLEHFSLTPAQGGWRVVVVDGADTLNPNAANALLKLLEEPPERSVFLLTASAPERLARTMRSRCARLALRTLSDADMRVVLRETIPGIGEERLASLIRLSSGSPGKAVALAGSDQDQDPVGGEGDLVARTQAAIRAHLTREGEPDRQASVARWCDRWSDVLRLDEATRRLNLDTHQLLIEARQAVRS